jgi:CMP-N,N'-diacetyllegionaminic acid synthase
MNKENLNTIIVIPARGGSKGLPGKNISLFHGHPLIAWPIEYAKKSALASDIVVSTDSEEIAEVAIKYGAQVPFLRTDEVSCDLATTEATLKFSLIEAEKKLNTHYDLCCFLTCTDLFRTSNWIDQGITFLQNNPEFESFFVANKTHKNFWEFDATTNQYNRLAQWMSVYSSRQIRKPIFREDTGLTCISRAHLWKSERRIGDIIKIEEDDRFETSIDIHSSFDLFLANTVFKWLLENSPATLPPIPSPV